MNRRIILLLLAVCLVFSACQSYVPAAQSPEAPETEEKGGDAE